MTCFPVAIVIGEDCTFSPNLSTCRAEIVPEAILKFFNEISLPSSLVSKIAPLPETDAEIPVSSVLEFIAATNPVVLLFAIVTSTAAAVALSPKRSNCTRPLEMPKSSRLLWAFASTPNLPFSLLNFAAIWPAIIPWAVVKSLVRPAAVVIVIADDMPALEEGKLFAAYKLRLSENPIAVIVFVWAPAVVSRLISAPIYWLSAPMEVYFAVYTASSAKPLVLLISSSACCSVSGLPDNCMPSRVKICKFASPRSAGITTPDTLFKFPEFNFANEE